MFGRKIILWTFGMFLVDIVTRYYLRQLFTIKTILECLNCSLITTNTVFLKVDMFTPTFAKIRDAPHIDFVCLFVFFYFYSIGIYYTPRVFITIPPLFPVFYYLFYSVLIIQLNLIEDLKTFKIFYYKQPLLPWPVSWSFCFRNHDDLPSFLLIT